MANCFFCNTKLVHEQGMKKIGVPLENGDFAFVEIDSPHHCTECQESYLDTEQLLEGFEQIKESLDDVKPIGKGIYK